MRRPCQRRSADEMSEGGDPPRRRLRGDRRRSLRHHFSYVEAPFFGISLSISIVLYVLFGGTQSVLGPLLGAAAFTLLPELLRGSAQWRYVLFAAVVIVVMVLRPQGLVTGVRMPRLFRDQRERARTGQAA